MSNADKDGWIRHRGGKCPVEDGAVVEARDRDGDIYRATGAELRWTHGVSDGDIMAYRMHKPAEQEVVMKKIADECGALSGLASKLERDLSGPLQWRDRIAEIDATTQALTTERAELVQKLASEGFALIGRVVDMSDSKKWMVGDLFTVNGGDDHDFEVGDKVVLIENDGTSRLLFANGGVENWVDIDRVEFHSRPSA